jgi:hypothetical protein
MPKTASRADQAGLGVASEIITREQGRVVAVTQKLAPWDSSPLLVPGEVAASIASGGRGRFEFCWATGTLSESLKSSENLSLTLSLDKERGPEGIGVRAPAGARNEQTGQFETGLTGSRRSVLRRKSPPQRRCR